MHHTKHPDLATRNRPRAERGFSMAEVLIAIALLSVILLAVFGLITAGVNRAYGGKKMTEASVLAESVMERANIVEAQSLLADVDASATEKTWVWSKTRSNSLEASVTPAAEANPGPTVPITERNKWRDLFRNTNLPASTANNATLRVTMTALPAGRTFTNAMIVRIRVDVSWKEFGTRQRQVRLQTFNVRDNTV